MSGVEELIEYPKEENEDNNNYITMEEGFYSKKMLLKCNLCNIKVTSNKVLQRHLEGRKHIMRVQRVGKTFICDLCQVVANSERQLDVHMNSIKHKAYLARKQKKENMSLSRKGGYIIMIGIICIFVNFLILFKTML